MSLRCKVKIGTMWHSVPWATVMRKPGNNQVTSLAFAPQQSETKLVVHGPGHLSTSALVHSRAWGPHTVLTGTLIRTTPHVLCVEGYCLEPDCRSHCRSGTNSQFWNSGQLGQALCAGVFHVQSEHGWGAYFIQCQWGVKHTAVCEILWWWWWRWRLAVTCTWHHVSVSPQTRTLLQRQLSASRTAGYRGRSALISVTYTVKGNEMILFTFLTHGICQIIPMLSS